MVISELRRASRTATVAVERELLLLLRPQATHQPSAGTLHSDRQSCSTCRSSRAAEPVSTCNVQQPPAAARDRTLWSDVQPAGKLRLEGCNTVERTTLYLCGPVLQSAGFGSFADSMILGCSSAAGFAAAGSGAGSRARLLPAVGRFLLRL